MNFSDPQGGKGACDRRAANVKTHMKVNLNQGNDIENATQMVVAMKSSNGTPALNATLCDSLVTPIPLFQDTLDGVSSLSNIEYEKNYLRVWKAYGIGAGKQVKMSSLDTETNASIPALSTSSYKEVADKFSSVKSRVKPISKETSSTTDVKNENDLQDSVSAQLLFVQKKAVLIAPKIFFLTASLGLEKTRTLFRT